MKSIKIGFAPTRRSIFSAPDAIKYANLTRERLKELGVEFVDITDINEEGLLYQECDRIKIREKFQAAGVDGLFFPHTNFGTEFEVARLAREMGLPVLLWGPRDERPEPDGNRLRDSQCGIFATGKVLRRFRVPFTYMTNCRLTDPEFERGIKDFLAVCNVVKTFRSIRILQIGPRPLEFWSTMCNEGELLERFNVQLAPIPMPELTREIKKAKEEGVEVPKTVSYCRSCMKIEVTDDELETVAALKVAMKNLCQKYGCKAVAIQCWNELQNEIGIMPCAANSLLNEEGIPCVCETDIHGAITALMVEAASRDDKRSFFADWTVRHPDNENGELLQHCGPWPISVAKEQPSITYPLAFDHPGSVAAEAKHGLVTLARFDGDEGEYSLLLGTAKGIPGPYTMGTYLWVEVENLKRLEAKIVEGPYIHHCVGIHEDVVPVLYEACKYIGVKPDLYDNNEEQIKAYLRGGIMMNLKALSFDLRKDCVDIIMAGNGGHIGGDMSLMDILITLYFKEMNISPENMTDPNRDRFILSKGHAMESYYAVLCKKGFLDLEDVKARFSKFGSPYIGHPNNKLPGIEMNSGSLGHGLPVCVGMALAGKMDNAPYRVYTVMGDGELAEGSVWEGAMSGAHYGLDNLCAIVDRNRLQISGNTEDVMAHDSQQERWAAFGWNVITVDGHDFAALEDAFCQARACKGKPSVIIAETTKGYGSSVMENKAGWHHHVPSAEEYDTILADFAARKEAALHE